LEKISDQKQIRLFFRPFILLTGLLLLGFLLLLLYALCADDPSLVWVLAGGALLLALTAALLCLTKRRVLPLLAGAPKQPAQSEPTGLEQQDFGAQLRRLEEDLLKAREDAEQSSRSKGDFLSRMSHEIRTPLNAIIGMTGIAKSSDSAEKKEYCLDKIADASKQLLSVINDILDMSKIEAEKFELFCEEFDLKKTLTDVGGAVGLLAKEKNQTFRIKSGENVPQFIVTDEPRLNQVMTNLLTNAVKFTPEGGRIELNVDNIKEADGMVVLRIEVSDNGIGISDEQKARLFRAFEQGDNGISRKYGGMGLGLVIFKRIVDLMGGKIWVESELGKGSNFIFTIEVRKGAREGCINANDDVNRTETNPSGLRILAVDDSPETREYFLHLMSSLNIHCDVAQDGIEALALIEKNRDDPYSLFFVDWQMPNMDGITLTKKIKEISGGKAIVVMISVAARSDIEAAAAMAGVNRFVPKSLFPSDIIKTINECLGVSLDGKAAYDFKNHILLLAEDVEVNREIIQTMLEKTGITLECAANGKEAVALFEKHPGRYSAILMDIQMPEMNGYEATKKIRAMDAATAKEIPIIAMTADVFREDIDACLAAGMNEHIGKPVDTEELLTKLAAHLKPKAAPAKPGSSYKPLTSDAGHEQLTADKYEKFLPAIDVPNGLSRVMNNKKLYFTLLKNFSGRQMADELIKSIKDADFGKTAQIARTMRGTAANLGLKTLEDIAASVEGQATLKMDAAPLITALDEAADLTARCIKSLLEGGENI